MRVLKEQAKSSPEGQDFTIETKRQERFELPVAAESVKSTGERFTVDKEFLNEVNAVYCQLEMKKMEIVHTLFHRMFELESGWYNGHYHQKDSGEWQRESYPIPVIGVKGFCDIEIQFDKISVSSKLKRETALAYSYEKFAKYKFEVYGVEDYLADFYHQGQTIKEMKENICACDEAEIGFSFVFPFDIEGQQIFEFVKLIRNEGFYY